MTKRHRRAAAEPTEHQLFEGCIAFHTLLTRYRYEHCPDAPPQMRHVVRVVPDPPPLASEAEPKMTIHRFISADSARRWRTHEIIRETIKVAMRTKP